MRVVRHGRRDGARRGSRRKPRRRRRVAHWRDRVRRREPPPPPALVRGLDRLRHLDAGARTASRVAVGLVALFFVSVARPPCPPAFGGGAPRQTVLPHPTELRSRRCGVGCLRRPLPPVAVVVVFPAAVAPPAQPPPRLRRRSQAPTAAPLPHRATHHPLQASAVADDAVANGAALASALSAGLAAAIASSNLTAAIASAAAGAGSSAFAAARWGLARANGKRRISPRERRRCVGRTERGSPTASPHSVETAARRRAWRATPKSSGKNSAS